MPFDRKFSVWYKCFSAYLRCSRCIVAFEPLSAFLTGQHRCLVSHCQSHIFFIVNRPSFQCLDVYDIVLFPWLSPRMEKGFSRPSCTAMPRQKVSLKKSLATIVPSIVLTERHAKRPNKMFVICFAVLKWRGTTIFNGSVI